MRLLGTGQYDANRTTMTNSLAQHMLLQPEIANNVVNLFEDNFTAFSSFLARRGMVKRGLYPGLNNDDFRVVGNRKVMWAIKGYPFKKGQFAQDADSPVNAAQLGLGNTLINIYLNTNWFSPNDVLELGDRNTLLQIMDEYPEEISSNVYKYKTKLVTNTDTDYVDADLVAKGKEAGFSYTQFHELSETGYEKNTYPEWLGNYMTIQRMQFSISGSAHNSVMWVTHQGQKLWFRVQEMEMLRRWAYARENQFLWGKATVDLNSDRVFLKDLKGREIIGGDGVLNSGDASLKFQYQKLSFKVLENIMSNMQLLSNGEGITELLLMGGQALIWEFQKLMRDVFKYNPDPLYVSSDGGQGVRTAFNSYEIGGVRIVTVWNKAFDAAFRPSEVDTYGVKKQSRRGIFASLGNTVGGEPNIQLIALGNGSEDRRYVRKVIDGMVSPGGTGRREYSSNSVDGFQVQILSECGLCVKNPFGIAEIYQP